MGAYYISYISKKSYNHISLGEVKNLLIFKEEAICYTVADDIQYLINLIDLTDY